MRTVEGEAHADWLPAYASRHAVDQPGTSRIALEGDDLGELCRAEDVAALEGVIEDRDVVQATDTLLLRFVVPGEEAATIIFGEAAVARPTGVAIVVRLARSRELLIEERALVLPTGGHREPKVLRRADMTVRAESAMMTRK